MFAPSDVCVAQLCSNIVDKATSTEVIYARNPDGSRRPLTAEEAAKLKTVYTEGMKPVLSDMATVREARDLIVKAKEGLAASQAASAEASNLKVEANNLKAEATSLKTEAQSLKTDAEKLSQSSKQHLAEATSLEASAQKIHAKAEELSNEILTKKFCAIFNPPEKDPQVFTKYSVSGSITLEKTNDTRYPKIHSLVPVIQYLKEHHNTKACNFIDFKTEINDEAVASFAKFLATESTSVLRGVAFHSGISEAAKRSLADAAAARATKGFPLKVQYFA